MCAVGNRWARSSSARAGRVDSGLDLCMLGTVDYVLDVLTPLGIRVRCTQAQWERISVIKHPPMRGRLSDVRETLVHPDEVRRSVRDANVLLFHRRVEPRWVCAVARREDGEGFLVTAYPADKIKQGELVWTK